MWDILELTPFQDWYEGLDEQAREDIAAYLMVLAQMGPSLGRPYADTLQASRFPNMKELRVQSAGRPLRVLFAFDPLRNAVLLIGGDKTGDKRFYKRMIPIADALFETYLAGEEHHGVRKTKTGDA